MSQTYGYLKGMRGAATRRGSKNGVHVAAQSFEGSVIVRNWFDNDQLMVEVGTTDSSSCYTNYTSEIFTGTFEEFKRLLVLAKQIKSGEVSVVHHRKSH